MSAQVVTLEDLYDLIDLWNSRMIYCLTVSPKVFSWLVNYDLLDRCKFNIRVKCNECK